MLLYQQYLCFSMVMFCFWDDGVFADQVCLRLFVGMWMLMHVASVRRNQPATWTITISLIDRCNLGCIFHLRQVSLPVCNGRALDHCRLLPATSLRAPISTYTSGNTLLACPVAAVVCNDSVESRVRSDDAQMLLRCCSAVCVMILSSSAAATYTVSQNAV